MLLAARSPQLPGAPALCALMEAALLAAGVRRGSSLLSLLRYEADAVFGAAAGVPPHVDMGLLTLIYTQARLRPCVLLHALIAHR